MNQDFSHKKNSLNLHSHVRLFKHHNIIIAIITYSDLQFTGVSIKLRVVMNQLSGHRFLVVKRKPIDGHMAHFFHVG
jgi:hypothetical protein